MRSRPARTLLQSAAVAAIFFVCGRASAQVNTEPLRKKLKAKGWSAMLQGSLDARAGNTRGVDVATAGGIGFSSGPHLGFLFGNAEYARYNDATSVNNSFLHARYNYEFLSWLWGEGFAQLQSDQFQRILLRDLFGVGPRFAIYQSKEIGMFYGTGYMLEHDAISVLPGAPDRADYWEHRWNNYLSLAYTLDTRVTLAETFYLQPRFDDFTDVRMLDEAALIFKVTPVLSASITVSFHYDADPPTGVLRGDVDVKNALALTF
ncbi:MAG TPA: DUF481 domain-containing protein [Polyangiaceae bacterium]